jgi:hypothetical protein
VAACEASFQRHQKEDLEPGRLLSTQSSQLPADAQPIATDWLFSSASKPINLGLGFQVHWAHIQLGFPASTLVGTSNG